MSINCSKEYIVYRIEKKSYSSEGRREYTLLLVIYPWYCEGKDVLFPAIPSQWMNSERCIRLAQSCIRQVM